MTLLYVDTSAVARAYFPDEADHEELRELFFMGSDPVVTSELTRVELASAVFAASRARRIAKPREVLDRFDVDCGEEEAVFSLLLLNSAVVLPHARRLVTMYSVRTLDAIHIAVALGDATALAAGDEVKLVTRDKQQAAAARSVGLALY